MWRSLLLFSAILLLVFCETSQPDDGTSLDVHQREKIDRFSKLQARWNRLHPINLPPLTEEAKRFMKLYQAKAHLDKTDIMSEEEFNGELSNKLIEGDIIPSDQDIAELEEKLQSENAQSSVQRHNRAAPNTHEPLWDRNVPIPFKIESRFNETQSARIREKLQEIQDKTCISFQENGPGKKLEYVLSGECSSDIGDQRKYYTESQKIFLSPSCLALRGITHETMHALGFEHTQSRTDRDENLNFDVDNIIESVKNNYAKMSKDISSTNYGIPYEFNSIMHYGTHNPNHQIDPTKLTFLPTDLGYTQTIPGIRPTFNDWKMINVHYKCHETCQTQLQCQNGGYQNPRRCEQCVCPQFFNGTLCEIERHSLNFNMGDVSELHYGFELNKTTANDMDLVRKNYLEGNYAESTPTLVKGPKGSRIVVTIHAIYDGERFCPATCEQKALEIVDGDLTRVGKRFCCYDLPEKFPYSFTSISNVVGYVVRARHGLNFNVNATFKIVEAPQTTGEPNQTTAEPEKASTIPVEEVTTVASQTSQPEVSTQEPLTDGPSTSSRTEISESEATTPQLEEVTTALPSSSAPVSETVFSTEKTVEKRTTESQATSVPEVTLEPSTSENSTGYSTSTEPQTEAKTTEDPNVHYPTTTTTETPATNKSKMREVLDSINLLLSNVKDKLNRLSDLVGW